MALQKMYFAAFHLLGREPTTAPLCAGVIVVLAAGIVFLTASGKRMPAATSVHCFYS